MVLGIVIGIFSTANLNENEIILEYEQNNKVMIFVNSFCKHYFYLFIIWLLGFVNLGFIISFFIGFFKSFIEGVSLGVIIKTINLLGIGYFIKYRILEILVILPVLAYVLYNSVKRNFDKNINNDQYIKTLFLMTLFVVIYSVIKTLI